MQSGNVRKYEPGLIFLLKVGQERARFHLWVSDPENDILTLGKLFIVVYHFCLDLLGFELRHAIFYYLLSPVIAFLHLYFLFLLNFLKLIRTIHQRRKHCALSISCLSKYNYQITLGLLINLLECVLQWFDYVSELEWQLLNIIKI